MYGNSPEDKEIHVMVDLETYGTAVDSVILSIGACTFEPGDVGTFYTEINPEYQWGRNKYQKTVHWWNQQVIRTPNGILDLEQAILAFKDWLWELTVGKKQELIIWSNGTDFDIAILYHAMAQFSMEMSWKYDNVRDFRTLRKTFPQVTHEFHGTKHYALDDAINEAEHCVKILTYIELLARAEE